MLADMFKAIMLLAFTTKLLSVIHWLILARSVFVKVGNSALLLLSIKRAVSSSKNWGTVSGQEGRSLT